MRRPPGRLRAPTAASNCATSDLGQHRTRWRSQANTSARFHVQPANFGSPVSRETPHSMRVFERFHLPMQKLEKISPSKSSTSMRPVNRPIAEAARARLPPPVQRQRRALIACISHRRPRLPPPPGSCARVSTGALRPSASATRARRSQSGASPVFADTESLVVCLWRRSLFSPTRSSFDASRMSPGSEHR
jgi:hypothetical protein